MRLTSSTSLGPVIVVETVPKKDRGRSKLPVIPPESPRFFSRAGRAPSDCPFVRWAVLELGHNSDIVTPARAKGVCAY